MITKMNPVFPAAVGTRERREQNQFLKGAKALPFWWPDREAKRSDQNVPLQVPRFLGLITEYLVFLGPITDWNCAKTINMPIASYFSSR